MSEIREKIQEVDIVGLLLLLWNGRRRIILNCIIALVLAIVVAFSIPKKYTSAVVMAPEISASGGFAGGLGEIAAIAGVNIGGLSGNDDALYPELYPQIVSSTPFLIDILSMEVETNEGDSLTLYDFISKHTKTPWWVKIYSVPMNFFKRLFVSEEPGSEFAMSSGTSTVSYTKKQYSTMMHLEKSIAVDVDKGNSLVTINVSLQDKKLAADVANAIAERLKLYIEDYRSAKSRKDLEYSEKLYEEFKAKYIDAQKEYAKYANLHQNVVNMKYQVELSRLQNEMDLAFGIYSQMAQTLEMARAKVQEDTPVCVVIQPAYVQIKASSPKKIMMATMYLFLAFFGTSAWIIIKDRIVKK